MFDPQWTPGRTSNSIPALSMLSVDLIRWPAGGDVQRREFLGVLGGCGGRVVERQEAQEGL
jgi:hypothetical protein